VDLLMSFYEFHLHSWLLLQIKVETKQKSDTHFLSYLILSNGGGGSSSSNSS
jgi:hypothetical protein